MPVTIIIGLLDFYTKMLYNVLKSDNTLKNVVGLTMRLNWLPLWRTSSLSMDGSDIFRVK